MFVVMVVKAAVGVVLWVGAAWLAGSVVRLIPEGRIRRLLTRPIGAKGTRTGRRRAAQQ